MINIVRLFVMSLAMSSALLGVAGEAFPAFDAATVTGDELVELLRSRKKRPTREEYAELNRLLKGRELVFHDLCIYGWGDARRSLTDAVRSYELMMRTVCDQGVCKISDERFNVAAVFTDERDIRYADRVRGSNSRQVMIKELAGVVTDSQMSDFKGSLQLMATSLVPMEPIEELPDFDADSITGDELAKLCQTFKMGMSDNAYGDLNALLLDRELSFTDVQVVETVNLGNGFIDLSCVVGNRFPVGPYESPSHCLGLVARVSTKAIDDLPWGFTCGDKISRLIGKVTEPFNSGQHRRFQGLPLTGATFDVAWKNDKLPTYDAATVTGDELVKMIVAFDAKTRPAKQERLCRDLCGRRLSFTDAKVRSIVRSDHDGQVVVMLGFGTRGRGCSRGAVYACELEAVFPKGEAADVAVQLTRGQEVRSISGVMTATKSHSRGYAEENDIYRLTEVTFEADEPEPLPPFDAKTITGDELVKLVWTLKGELSPAHVAELQTRLAGRRLTFHGAWRSGASGSGAQITEVGFKYFDNPRSKDRREFSFWVGLRDPEPLMSEHHGKCIVTATVSQPVKCRHGEGLVLEDAVQEW